MAQNIFTETFKSIFIEMKHKKMCFFSYHRLYTTFMSFDARLARSYIWLWTFKRLKLRIATICLRQKLAKEMAITF